MRKRPSPTRREGSAAPSPAFPAAPRPGASRRLHRSPRGRRRRRGSAPGRSRPRRPSRRGRCRSRRPGTARAPRPRRSARFGVEAPHAGVKRIVWFEPRLLVDALERAALPGALPGAAEGDPPDVHRPVRVEPDRRMRRRRHADERAVLHHDPGRVGTAAALGEEVAVHACHRDDRRHASLELCDGLARAGHGAGPEDRGDRREPGRRRRRDHRIDDRPARRQQRLLVERDARHQRVGLLRRGERNERGRERPRRRGGDA